jgi:ankyrin repeat protein
MKKTVLPKQRTTSMECVSVSVLDKDETNFQKAIDTSNFGEIKELLQIYDVNEPLFGLGLYVTESRCWDEDFPSNYVHRKNDKQYFKIDGPYCDISDKKSGAFDIVRCLGDYILWTPLHYAASIRNKEVVNFLIKNGANETWQDSLGYTYKDLFEYSKEIGL